MNENSAGGNHLDTYRAAGVTGAPEALAGRPGQATEIVNAGIRAALTVKPDDTIVDIGCGDGSLLASLVPARRRIGTTSSAEEAAVLTARYAGGDMTFVPGLADNLPIEDGAADIVICNGVLLLLPDAETVQRALAEIARIARPGAQIYIGEMPEGARGWSGFLARPVQIVETHGPAELVRRLLRKARRDGSSPNAGRESSPPSSRAGPTYVTAVPAVFEGWSRAAGLTPVLTFRHTVKRNGQWLEYPRNRWNYTLKRA